LLPADRLWSALDTLRDGFALFDSNLRLVAANRAYLSAFQDAPSIRPGMSYGEMLASAAQGVVDLAGRSAAEWLDDMASRLDRQEVPSRIVRLRSGRHIRLVERRSPSGDLVSHAVDVTRAVQREQELQAALQQAEETTRAKSAFLASMSHEIRTPMNGVVGMAELLCGSGLNADQRLFAETIKSSGEALLTIINDVLDYSKIEANKMRLYVESFDLERLIHEVMMLVTPAAREKGLALGVDFDLFLPTTYLGDRGRIRQILTNLVGNAVKFTRKGHILVRVVGLETEPGHYELHLTVEDTGMGIAPENRSRIFAEFDQVEDRANRAIEGTGLGLAITRRLVDMMNGSIWVDSELGRGSSFGIRLTLPLAENHPGGDKVEQLTVRRALLVDDDLFSAALLERQLRTYGLTTTHCPGLAGTLDLIAATPAADAPDVVLIDPRLGDFDAEVFLQAVRRSWQKVPPVILMVDSLGEWAALDPAAVLRKPIMRSDVYRSLLSLAGCDRIQENWNGKALRKVLLAEDNQTNQLVFRKMLQGFDLDLFVASNGREAVELWQTAAPDLIFMDISMPEMDGRLATQSIRWAEASQGRARVRIIALTAHEIEGTKAELLDLGFDGQLTKPFRQADLVDALKLSLRGPEPADGPV
jgi:hypothetical protein